MSFGYSGNNTSYMSGTCAWRTGITCIFYGAAFVSNSYAAVCICYATTCTCYGACICYLQGYARRETKGDLLPSFWRDSGRWQRICLSY